MDYRERSKIYWLINAIGRSRHYVSELDDEVGSEYYPINIDDVDELVDGEFRLVFAKMDEEGMDFDDTYALNIKVSVD